MITDMTVCKGICQAHEGLQLDEQGAVKVVVGGGLSLP